MKRIPHVYITQEEQCRLIEEYKKNPAGAKATRILEQLFSANFKAFCKRLKPLKTITHDGYYTDAMQDMFIEMVKAIKKFDSRKLLSLPGFKGNPIFFLYLKWGISAVRNRHLKEIHRGQLESELNEANAGYSIKERAEKSDVLLDKLIATSLTKKQRDTLKVKKETIECGYPIAKYVRKELGITHYAFNARLYKIRKKLKPILEEHGVLRVKEDDDFLIG